MSQVVRPVFRTKEPGNVFRPAQLDIMDLMAFAININALARLQRSSQMIQQAYANKSVLQALLEILQRENVFLYVQSHRIPMETQ